MRHILAIWMALPLVGLLAAPAGAGTIGAGAVLTAQADGPDFDYTVTLTNTGGAGGDPIATFWFAWVPGEDFLATSPISVTNPSGWKDVITHFPSVPTNGFAIQWDALTAADDLAPGGSLVFRFQSADPPASLMGQSVFYPDTPVLTSFVYSQGPLKGDGAQFLATFASVPEPSSLTLGIVAAAGTFAGLRLRRRSGA